MYVLSSISFEIIVSSFPSLSLIICFFCTVPSGLRIISFLTDLPNEKVFGTKDSFVSVFSFFHSFENSSAEILENMYIFLR